jgi:predicted esterase
LADPLGGFAWVSAHPHRAWPVHADLATASLRLGALIGTLRAPIHANPSIMLLGFSQGAATAAAFALENCVQIAGLALLAGFVAEPSDSLLESKPLRSLPVFLAYGTQDTLVPVPIAQRSIESLGRAGASLTVCDAAVGHKVSAACLRSLAQWFGKEWRVAERNELEQGFGGEV